MSYVKHPKSTVTLHNFGRRCIVSLVWHVQLPFSLADGDTELEPGVQSVLSSNLQGSSRPNIYVCNSSGTLELSELVKHLPLSWLKIDSLVHGPCSQDPVRPGLQ